MTGVGVVDNLPSSPAQMTLVDGGNASSPLVSESGCGSGTITAASGSSTITLAGASIAGKGTCTFVVNVTASTPGNYTNTTNNVTSNDGTGGTATATVTAYEPQISIRRR